jgi:hypothetical protein
MSKSKPKFFLNVKSTAERGHWRSGKFWPSTGTDVPLHEVTKAMIADPRLRIIEVEEESDAE